MARLKEIRYTVRALIKPRDFESIAFEYGEVIEPAPGDDISAIRAALIKRAKRVVEEDVLEARRDAGGRDD